MRLLPSITSCKTALLSAFIAVAGSMTAAQAAPVVAANSSYSLLIFGVTSGNPQTLTSNFDGQASSFTRNGLNLSVTESEVDLGGGSHRISLQLTANGDLYPFAGEQAAIGLGQDGNGLDIAANVRLDDARIILGNAAGIFFTSGNLAADYAPWFQLEPWNGFFARSGDVFGVGNAGGFGTNAVTLQFTVSDSQPIPEPGEALLIGTALCGMLVARRRQARRG